jgi:hypothetical protein
LDPVVSPVSDEGRAEEHPGRAADYVTALSKCCVFKIYELESDQCALEVQFPEISTPEGWLY